MEEREQKITVLTQKYLPFWARSTLETYCNRVCSCLFLFNLDHFCENLFFEKYMTKINSQKNKKMIKIEQEQTRTNTIAIGFQGTP